MITKLINYLKYRFTPGITVAMWSGNVRFHNYAMYSFKNYYTYENYILYLKENQYGRKYLKYEGKCSFNVFKKYKNYRMAKEWMNGVKFQPKIPTYDEVKNGLENVDVQRNYWDKE